MGMTNLDQLTLSTGPVLPGSNFFTGNWYFVNATTGSDGNTGGASDPLSTLTEAYNRTTEGKNDVVVLMSSATTASPTAGTFRLSSQLVWAKSCTHLIGMTAPGLNQRARISTATGATTNIANLVNVTGQGCMFSNFSLFQGVGQTSTAEQLWQEAGLRNYYQNVFFGGMGSANGAGQAGSYSLKLYGSEEALFDGCYFGADTQSRTAANSNVLIRPNATPTAVTRAMFRNCTFAMYATQTTPYFVDADDASTIDRWVMFRNCAFVNSGTSSLASAVAGDTAQGGKVVLDNCSYVGVTEIGSLSNSAVIQVTGAVPNGNTSGVAVNANPS